MYHDNIMNLIGKEVEVTRSGETVVISTRQPGKGAGRSYEVDYRITLPGSTGLARPRSGGVAGRAAGLLRSAAPVHEPL